MVPQKKRLEKINEKKMAKTLMTVEDLNVNLPVRFIKDNKNMTVEEYVLCATYSKNITYIPTFNKPNSMDMFRNSMRSEFSPKMFWVLGHKISENNMGFIIYNPIYKRYSLVYNDSSDIKITTQMVMSIKKKMHYWTDEIFWLDCDINLHNNIVNVNRFFQNIETWFDLAIVLKCILAKGCSINDIKSKKMDVNYIMNNFKKKTLMDVARMYINNDVNIIM